MIADGLGLLFLAVGGASVAAWFAYKRNRKIGDEQLREWLSFITKSNGRPSSARLGAEPLLANSADGYAPKPDYRPLTKFENRGLKLGHGVWDLVYKKK